MRPLEILFAVYSRELGAVMAAIPHDPADPRITGLGADAAATKLYLLVRNGQPLPRVLHLHTPAWQRTCACLGIAPTHAAITTYLEGAV